MICGSLCSVHASSCMHGRLELMQPAFQVVIFNVEVRCLSVRVLVVEVWVGLAIFVVGWYPFTFSVHLSSICRIWCGTFGISFFKVVMFIVSPLASFVLI